jgi:hypothetical protein
MKDKRIYKSKKINVGITLITITAKVRGLPQGWNCCCVRTATEADLKN